MIIRPRLSDYYDVPLLQSEVDFAIPFIDEDIPLYVDPFLMWKSPSQMDNMLHLGIMQAINQLGYMYCSKEKDKAVDYLIFLSECDEVGLGTSKTRHGRQINKEQARDISAFDKFHSDHYHYDGDLGYAWDNSGHWQAEWA